MTIITSGSDRSPLASDYSTIAKAYSKVLLIAGALSLLLLAKKNETESETAQRRYISIPKRRKYATVDMAAKRMY